jgi:hypothetical protein
MSFLGSKIPYQAQEESSAYEKPPSSCKPVYLSMLARHGSRYISDDRSMITAHKEFSNAHELGMLTTKGDEVYQWLKKMEGSFKIGDLTKQGEQEHFGIGKRIFQSYPDLFSGNKVLLSTTHINRTMQSRDSFLKGLNQSVKVPNHYEYREGNKCEDLEGKFFSNCSRFKKYAKGEAKEIEESLVRKIYGSEQFRKYRDENLQSLFRIEHLANIEDKIELKILENIYKLCQQDYNIDPNEGERRFCSVLHPEIKKIFQFSKEDLQTYYYMGPVKRTHDKNLHGITYKMSCPALKSFLNDIETLTKGENDSAAHFRFAHVETVLPLAVLMGIFETDKDLTEANPQWQSQKIAGMASNIQWIAYKCSEEGKETYKVKMLYNEKEYHFPISSCRDSEFCDWDTVKAHYQKRLVDLGLGSCSVQDWNQLCDNASDNGKMMCLKK